MYVESADIDELGTKVPMSGGRYGQKKNGAKTKYNLLYNIQSALQ